MAVVFDWPMVELEFELLAAPPAPWATFVSVERVESVRVESLGFVVAVPGVLLVPAAEILDELVALELLGEVCDVVPAAERSVELGDVLAAWPDWAFWPCDCESFVAVELVVGDDVVEFETDGEDVEAVLEVVDWFVAWACRPRAAAMSTRVLPTTLTGVFM